MLCQGERCEPVYSSGELARQKRSTPAPWCSLRQLMMVRNIAVVGQVYLLLVLYRLMSPMQLTAIAAISVLLVLWNAGVLVRLQRPTPVTDREVLIHVIADIAALTLLLHFGCGDSNPFFGVLVLPLAVAAARLPYGRSVGIALLTLICAGGLVLYHVELPDGGEDVRELLVFGSWLSYLVCGGFIARLAFLLAGRLRDQERLLSERERGRRNEEYLVRVGSLAAGVAHEIRSPLCTMAVLVNELMASEGAQAKRNLRLMSEQIEACRRILSELMTYGQDGAAEGPRSAPVDEFLHELVAKCRALRPGVNLVSRRSGTHPAPCVATHTGLGHAILNLLNNAADASPDCVEMECSWTPRSLKVSVLDRGPGIPQELSAVLGERFVTTKRDKGTGIGLLLARSAIEKAGGTLRLQNRPEGGACAEVVVPLGEAAAGENRTATPVTPYEVRYYKSSTGET